MPNFETVAKTYDALNEAGKLREAAGTLTVVVKAIVFTAKDNSVVCSRS